ncbi:ankyrin repeat domain-containing protein [Marinobacter lacisalsi]|uniref:Ankyrin repeat domain-containing protein n=1 Tax=Marinobacter lacisalsi TaxID=475979 RepID=A0ABV8QE29_9GAMM
MNMIANIVKASLFLLLLSSVACASSPVTDTGASPGKSEYQDFLAQVVGGNLKATTKDDQGRPAVITAVIYGSDEDLQLVLNQGADPNATFSGLTALQFAVSDSCRAEKVGILINAGADVNRSGKILDSSPLHLAAQHQNAACVAALANAGADVNAQDNQGETAYFYAIDFASEPAIETLSSLGADPTIARKDGLDIFQWAIVNDRAGLVKPLVFKLVEQD